VFYAAIPFESLAQLVRGQGLIKPSVDLQCVVIGLRAWSTAFGSEEIDIMGRSRRRGGQSFVACDITSKDLTPALTPASA
jgi:hypothetical protein